MKFEDLKVGSTYKPPNGVNRKIVYIGADYVVAELAGYSYPTVFTSVSHGKDAFHNWSLVYPAIRVFAFLDATGYLFHFSDLKKADGVRTERRNLGHQCGAIWELNSDV